MQPEFEARGERKTASLAWKIVQTLAGKRDKKGYRAYQLLAPENESAEPTFCRRKKAIFLANTEGGTMGRHLRRKKVPRHGREKKKGSTIPLERTTAYCTRESA